MVFLNKLYKIVNNPWEIIKLDTQFKVRFYGYCKDNWRDGK